ncbi:MAG: 4Fe-4S binding protein [Bacillota bacterium]
MLVRRRLVQFLSTLLANAKLGNFLSGQIYRGPLKQVCVPFLNCYGCPAALGACPLGSLQSLAEAPQSRLSFYVWGGMLLAGGLAGRFICGWLCPFGLLQDLLKRGSRIRLRLPKYLPALKFLLLPLVVLLPAVVVDQYGFGSPYFCQFICPAGTLTAGLPLLASGPEFYHLIGPLFWFKLALLFLILAAAVIYYRPFCRVLCPLGAFWGLFNRIAYFRLIAAPSCAACGRCSQTCPVQLTLPGQLNSSECIRCLDCVKACPHGALKFTSCSSGVDKGTGYSPTSC